MTLTLVVLVLVAADATIKFLSRGEGAAAQAQKQPQEAFVRTYRFKDLSFGYGIRQTREGYALSGTTVLDKAMANTDGFAAKLDGKGNILWSKLYQSFSKVTHEIGNQAGEEDFSTAIEAGGKYVFGGTILGFIDDKYMTKKEMWNDYFISLFDTKGNHIWSKMMGWYNEESNFNIISAEPGAFYIAGNAITEGTGEIEDTDAAPHFMILGKYDLAGNKVWLKRINLYKSQARRAENGDMIVLGYQLTDRVSPTNSIMTDLPVVARINPEGKVIWARSIEALPINVKTAKVVDGQVVTETIQMRNNVANFQDIVPLVRGGYLAIGTTGLLDLAKASDLSLEKMKIVGVKFSENGDFEWAKYLDFKSMLYGSLHAEPAADGGVLISQGYYHKDPDIGAKQERYLALSKEIKDKFSKNYKIGDEKKDPVLKKLWADWEAAGAAYNAATYVKIFASKLADDFSPSWARSIGGTKGTELGGLAPENGGGALLTGKYVTNDLNKVEFNLKHYFEDVILVKFDASGAWGNSKLVGELPTLPAQNAEGKVTSQPMALEITDFSFSFDKKVTPKVSNIKVKTK
jgi:hypothetical protein